jgi:hypothetical protein
MSTKQSASKKLLLPALLLVSGIATAAPVTIPNTFTSGTPAVAAEVNANFTAVKTAVDDNNNDIISLVTALDSAYRFTEIYFTAVDFSTSFGSSVSEVLTTTCPTGSILVGGGVKCSGTGGTNSTFTNFGVVNATIPAGNSIIGTCSADAITYSNLKNGPGITVTAICLSPAIIPPQRPSIAAMDGSGESSAGQGVPSSEALLTIEKLITDAATRQTMLDQ